ncbi:MAG: hypothetical protein IT209_02100 [Armatimonadetes bacterium]|nr:hypothetical protein [Armatimonadota bacterium]
MRHIQCLAYAVVLLTVIGPRCAAASAGGEFFIVSVASPGSTWNGTGTFFLTTLKGYTWEHFRRHTDITDAMMLDGGSRHNLDSWRRGQRSGFVCAYTSGDSQ